MNVLIITNWYPTRKNPVAGVFVKEFAEAISNYCRVTVFHPEGCNDVKLYRILTIDNGKFKVIKLMYKRLPSSILSYLIEFILSTLWLLKNYRRFSPDVIHAHNYLAGLWAIIIGKVAGIPVIITEHGFHREGDDYKRSKFQSLRNRFRFLIAKIVFNLADMLVFVSRASRDYITQLFNLTTANRVVPNVLNNKFLNIKIYNVNEATKDGKKRILFIGGLYPRKGVEYLIEAVKILSQERKDFIVEIIGYGPFRQRYERLVNEYGLTDVVKFLGRVSDEEKIKALKNCDFFVLPSLYENFGIVLIEAMACGKPVITTSSGGQVEFINESNGLLVKPKDVKALANAIKFMLDNYNRYSPKKISYYVKKRFNQNVVGSFLREIYISILQKYNL